MKYQSADFWNNNWKKTSDDGVRNHGIANDDDMKEYVLYELELLLRSGMSPSSLKDYGIPLPKPDMLQRLNNTLFMEELKALLRNASPNASSYLDNGDCDRVCEFCNILFWHDERSVKASRTGNPKYSQCCKRGSVALLLYNCLSNVTSFRLFGLEIQCFP